MPEATERPDNNQEFPPPPHAEAALEIESPSESSAVTQPRPGFRQRISSILGRFHTPAERNDEELNIPHARSVFENPQELHSATELPDYVARGLIGIDLRDERQIMGAFYGLGLDWDENGLAMNKIREYRINNNLAIKPNVEQLAESIQTELQYLDPQQAKSYAELLSDVGDIANDSEVMKALSSSENLNVGSGYNSIVEIVRKQVKEQIKQEDTMKAETEGRSWNLSLQETGGELFNRLQDLAENAKITPETRQSIKDFLGKAGGGVGKGLREAGREGKELLKTLKPKDWREAAMLVARGVSDINPLIGVGIGAGTLGVAAFKEGRTIGRIKAEKDPGESTLSKWFQQTTIGKVFSEDSRTGLSKWRKRAAGATGAVASVAASATSKAVGNLVNIPFVKGSVKSAAYRTFYQYFTPRVIDYMASKIRFEEEGQKEEWVELALKSTSAANIVIASIGLGVTAKHIIDNTDFTEVREKVGEVAKQAEQQIGEKVEEMKHTVPAIAMATKTAHTPTTEPTVQVVEGAHQPGHTPTHETGIATPTPPEANLPEYYDSFDDPGIESLYGQTIAHGVTENGVHWIKTHDYSGDDPKQWAILYDLDGNGAPDKIIVPQADGEVAEFSILETKDGGYNPIQTFEGSTDQSTAPVEIKQAMTAAIPTHPEPEIKATSTSTPHHEPTPTPEKEPVLEAKRSPLTGKLEAPQHETETTSQGAAQPPETTSPEIHHGEGLPAAESHNGQLVDLDGDGKPDVVEYSDGSHVSLGEDGKPAEAVLADGKRLLFDEKSIGVPGIQNELRQIHGTDWSPKEIAVAAQRAYSEGIHAGDVDKLRDLQRPEFPHVLGKAVPDKQINIDMNGDGKPDAHWDVDEQGNIVGGTTSNNEHLVFDPNGIGVQALHNAIANLDHSLNPDQVAALAQRAYQDGINPNDHNAVQDFVHHDLPKIEAHHEGHPPAEAPRPARTPAVQPAEQLPDLAHLEKGESYDANNDGIEDSWWLKNENGDVVAGHLPDDRILLMDERGGTTGVMQHELHQMNENLAPEQVAHAASEVVQENDLKLPEKAGGGYDYKGIVGEKELLVNHTVNENIAKYSFEKLLSDQYDLSRGLAHDIAWRRIPNVHIFGDQVVSEPVGAAALGKLNARFEVGDRVIGWNDRDDWNKWLADQGMLN
jgi:hypothetical protein